MFQTLRQRSSECSHRSKARRDAESPLVHKASHGTLTLKLEGDAEAGQLPRISGYGSKFNLTDSYNETIKKGAFRASLAEWRKEKKPIPMLWQHDGGEPIGGWDVFKEDDTGLYLEGFLIPDMPYAGPALASMKANVVTGLSIGYYEIDADPWYDPEREGPRVIRKLDLRECSAVTFPALREAQLDPVKAAKARGLRPTLREFEDYLRGELGISSREAAEIAVGGYKAWIARERGPEATHQQGAAACSASIDEALASLRAPLFS